MQGTNVLVPPTPNSNSGYLYDLDATRICVAVLCRRNGQKIDFWCHLRQPTDDAVIHMLREREIYFRPAKGDAGQDIERAGSYDEDRQFFDAHLIAVVYDGKEISKEELDAVDPLFRIRINAVQFLVGVATPTAETIEGLTIPNLADIIAGKPQISQTVMLGDDSSKEHRFGAVQTFTNPSAPDALNFQRVSKIRMGEGGSQRIITNYPLISKLYRSMVESAEGFIIRDSPDRTPLPCTMSNKNQWVDKIPFVFKLHAVKELFREAERKNA
jgi:hypothetical protein